MNENEIINVAKLVTAFAKAKLDMGKLIASEKAEIKSEKGSYSYRYADLAGVLDVIDKPLASNGLVFVQSPVVDYSQSGARVTVHGTLHHESGEYLHAAPLVMVSNQTDPQKVGSAITYGRRYQAVAFFGLAQEDDDGKSAGEKPKQPTQQQRQAAPAPQPAQHRQQPPQTNGATKPAAPAPVITQSEIDASDAITLDNVPEMSQDGHGVDPAQIHSIAESFNLPKDAWDWATRQGYRSSVNSAQTVWIELVKELGGYTPAKMPQIAAEYVKRCISDGKKEQVAS